ncbi:uncharacterized protein EI90DRAFT_3028447 [Cantharellus anzutake]|uniref:uncharacterized protein n=1 Tax=Cantharellus anzutake TaxID=1750568 RepID=UPI001904E3E7|nr:uncharacterized protein EI90DRAFT_3028447 [Cantharellus anzutake]KAF8344150.1 hypothetical protein EI90DRAFT_3028447 [Cantharellus anzutake]
MMLLASRGVFQATKAAVRPRGAASFHTPSIARSPTNAFVQTTATSSPRNVSHSLQKSLSRLFSRFLSARGVATTPLSYGFSSTRSAHVSASVPLQSSLSLPSRIALSKPFGAPFMPRGPIVLNRSVAQVGLGTARNFSNGRPIFQNLVQNVPVAGRAFFEADVDFRFKNDVRIRSPVNRAKENKTTIRKEMKPINITPVVSLLSTVGGPVPRVEPSQYFSESPSAPYITTLSIPLAPNGARAPLEPLVDSDTYSKALDIHNSFEQHSIRVASLFRRLDRVNVWANGATVDCLDIVGDGLCRMINVHLDGWTEEMLREVIGDAGAGWCRITSIPKEPTEPVAQSIDSSFYPSPAMDQMEFDMPTLDFSASFYASPLGQRGHEITESFASPIFDAVGETTEQHHTMEESDIEGSVISSELFWDTSSEAGSDSGNGTVDMWQLSPSGIGSRISISSSFERFSG